MRRTGKPQHMDMTERTELAGAWVVALWIVVLAALALLMIGANVYYWVQQNM